jgi:hypothetical protein
MASSADKKQLATPADSRDLKDIMLSIKGKTLTRVRDPWFQTVSISTGSGAIVFSSVGGAFGTAAGVVVGTTAGALPALFTFGLSLPVGAVTGGGVGLCAGTIVGGSTGALCGSAAGHGAYTYRVEIKDGLMYVRAQAVKSVDKAKLIILDKTGKIKAQVKTAALTTRASAVKLTQAAKAKMALHLAKAYAAADATVHDRRMQVTTVSAVGGAAVCAPVGGVIGMVAGGVIGLVPALFTFGLSVPFCAVIGGGMGVSSGGSMGAVAGGSVGFGGYTYRKEIGKNTELIQKKVLGSAELVKVKAAESATYACESVKTVLSGTGGTGR